ncbi:hypothetical protein MMC07_000887 [Pseudocyphellaria aurata]|nr:hypothetical protein [Pseudocyphellaria aurata]
MPDPSLALQAAFLISTSMVEPQGSSMSSVPTLRSRFVAYGSRATPTSDGQQRNLPDAGETGKESDQAANKFSPSKLLDDIASIRVPHRWFIHFYLASLLSSALWGYQILTRGFLVRIICENPNLRTPRRSMSVDQVFWAWFLMSVQGLRRFLESLADTKASTSEMFLAHWLLGLTFYMAMGVAIWIEGAEALLSVKLPFHSITLTAPSLRTLLSLSLFTLASVVQHDCHAYLASLPKYTLPMRQPFQYLICPHYTAECLIYLSLAFLAAPDGSLFNRTILTALMFVSINLSVTASTTMAWYAQKFGEEKVAGRWKMLPYVF